MLRVQVRQTCTAFSLNAGTVNPSLLGPYVYMANTILTETDLQPLDLTPISATITKSLQKNLLHCLILSSLAICSDEKLTCVLIVKQLISKTSKKNESVKYFFKYLYCDYVLKEYLGTPKSVKLILPLTPL